MANVEMVIDSIRVSLQNYQRVVILKEKEGARYLPIWIGPAEADAIAVKMQGIQLHRPLTHDFTLAIANASGATLKSAIIDSLDADTFYAKIILEVNKEEKTIDCRPSDALAMAVRVEIPVFVAEEVLTQVGVFLPKEEPAEAKAEKRPFDLFSEDTKEILAESQAEAKRLNRDYVCTGHVLTALLGKKGITAKVMKSAGTTLSQAQGELKAFMQNEQDSEGGGAGLTSAVKEAIQISVLEAEKLGSEQVLPEHLLLGLAQATDSVAADQLRNWGVTPDIIYAELARLAQ